MAHRAELQRLATRISKGIQVKLRKYQQEAHDNSLAAFAEGKSRTLVILPTGGGKTIVAAHVTKAMLQKGRVMVLAHRDELIRQAVIKFHKVTGIEPAIEKADEFSEEDGLMEKPPIVVSTIQTQNSGTDELRRMARFDPKEFSLLWVDECHHAVSATWKRCIDYYANGNPDLKILFVTATPDRADERGLAEICDHIAFDYELPDIIRDGYLVPIRQKRVRIEGLEFSKIHNAGDDFAQGELEAAMMVEKPLHGVIQATIETSCDLEIGFLETLRDDEERDKKLAARMGDRLPRKTLTFTVSVSHAERTAEIINRWIPRSAAALSGESPEEDRRGVLKKFANGSIRFLVNCALFLEGFDEPSIEVVAMARPTKSRMLYAQAVGRGTRPLESIAAPLGELEDPAERRKLIADSPKKYLTVLDFVGNSGKHKLVCSCDILGTACPQDVIDRAAEIAEEEEIDAQAALDRAGEEIESGRAAEAAMAEASAEDADAADEMRITAAAARRLSLVGTGQYSIQQVSAFDPHDIAPAEVRIGPNGITPKQVDFLRKLGVSVQTASGYSKAQASAVIGKLKLERCTKPQGWRLKTLGYSEDAISSMNFEQASQAIDSAMRVNA